MSTAFSSQSIFGSTGKKKKQKKKEKKGTYGTDVIWPGTHRFFPSFFFSRYHKNKVFFSFLFFLARTNRWYYDDVYFVLHNCERSFWPRARNEIDRSAHANVFVFFCLSKRWKSNPVLVSCLTESTLETQIPKWKKKDKNNFDEYICIVFIFMSNFFKRKERR